MASTMLRVPRLDAAFWNGVLPQIKSSTELFSELHYSLAMRISWNTVKQRKNRTLAAMGCLASFERQAHLRQCNAAEFLSG